MKYIHIKTPDNIEISYPLATVASRVMAAGIDLLIQIVLYLPVIIYSLVKFLKDMIRILSWSSLEGALGRISIDIIGGIIIVYTFAVFFLYPIITEYIYKGQTPGKKMVGLRAIRENGMPMGITHIVIRNLFKVMLEVYGIGAVVMACSKENKRIGDMMASTVVIIENPEAIDMENLTTETTTARNFTATGMSLTPMEYEIIREYFIMRPTLENRYEILDKIQTYFGLRYKIPMELLSEDTLEALYQQEMSRY